MQPRGLPSTWLSHSGTNTDRSPHPSVLASQRPSATATPLVENVNGETVVFIYQLIVSNGRVCYLQNDCRHSPKEINKTSRFFYLKTTEVFPPQCVTELRATIQWKPVVNQERLKTENGKINPAVQETQPTTTQHQNLGHPVSLSQIALNGCWRLRKGNTILLYIRLCKSCSKHYKKKLSGGKFTLSVISFSTVKNASIFINVFKVLICIHLNICLLISKYIF